MELLQEFRREVAEKCSNNLPASEAKKILDVEKLNETKYRKQREQDALVLAHIMYPLRAEHDDVLDSEFMREAFSQFHGRELRVGAVERRKAKVDPVINWCSRLSMAAFACVVSILYLFLASDLFNTGPKIYVFFKDKVDFGQIFMMIGMLIAALLYVFDVGYWEGKLTTVKYGAFSMIVVLIVLCVWCSYSIYPAGPSFLYMWVLFFYFGGLKMSIFIHSNMATFLDSLSFAFAVCSTMFLFVWLEYIYRSKPVIDDESESDDEAWGQWYSSKMQDNLEKRLECSTNEDDRSYDDDDADTAGLCQLAAFLMWSAPLIAAVTGYVFSCLLRLLTVATFEALHHDNETRNTHQVQMMFKALVFFIVLAFAITWVSASFAGGDMEIADLIIDFMMFSFVFIGIMAIAIFGWEQIKKAMFRLTIMKKVKYLAESDAAKALGLLGGSPFIAIYGLLSLVTQFNRKHLSCTKPIGEREKKFVLTATANSLIRMVYKWNLVGILVWMHWWSIIYFTLNVGIRVVTYVFLSWLIESLGEGFDNFIVIIVIYYIAGIALFLFPPVPGPPIYMTGGVLLVQIGQQKGHGFWNMIFLVIILSFSLKMMAITIQQKGFGEQLGKYVWVRKTIGINSLFIRALRKILSEPGMRLPKVAVLIGGPDWPTSALTGIMGLRLSSMLFGSIPIIFLIIPCVLTGAFQLRAPDKLCGGNSPCECKVADDDDTETWQAVSVFIILFTAMTQSASSILAMYYVDQYTDRYEEELMNNEEYRDVEVEKLEKEEEKGREAYKKITKWEQTPFWIKLKLTFGSFTCCLLVWIANMAYKRCFVKKFSITSRIECLPDGKVWNVIKPGGYIIIILFLVQIILLKLYYAWAKNAVSDYLADQKQNHPNGDNEYTSVVDDDEGNSDREKN